MSARREKQNLQANQNQIDELKKAIVTLAANQRISNRDVFGRGLGGAIDYSASHDTKRPQAWNAYGYPESLEFSDFYSMFTRHPIANAIVMKPVVKSWEIEPFISEQKDPIAAENKPTRWDDDLSAFFKRVMFWSRCQGADWRQRIGRYAGLVIVAKEKGLSELNRDEAMLRPLKLNSLDQIVKLIPVTEDQLEVLEDGINKNPTDLRYGMPEHFNYHESALGTKNDRARVTFNIHYSRVIIFAEGAETGVSIYGRPTLEPCFNNLINLEKIYGGGAEGYLLNARTPLNINMQGGDNAPDPAALAQLLGTDLAGLGDAFDEQIEDYVRGINNHLLTQGMDVKNLSISIPDPKEFVQTNLDACCAPEGIPSPELIGSQISQRSSDENAKSWAKTIEARWSSYLLFQIESVVEHFISIGALEKKEFFIHRDSLMNSSPNEKAELFKMLADGIKSLTGTGVAPPENMDKHLADVLGLKQTQEADEGGNGG